MVNGNAKGQARSLPRSWSEVQAQRELHDARVACRGDLAELRAGLNASGVVPLDARVYGAELRMVKGVVGLGSELHAQALVNANVLEQRQIPVVQAGSAGERA